MTHVLIVDDELSIRESFRMFLEEEGYDVYAATDFFEAEEILTSRRCDVVVADVILPRIAENSADGLALLGRVREIDEDIPVIMITGEPDVSTAAEAVRQGAYDYITRPVTQEMLIRLVNRAAERKRLLDEKRRLEAENRACRANLEGSVAKRTTELSTLIDISYDISATLDLNEVLRRVTRRAAQVCGAHRCTILLLAEDGERLIPAMSQFSDGHEDREIWRLFQGRDHAVLVSQIPEAQQVIRDQRALFVLDTSDSSLPEHLIEPFGIKSLLLVPLISKEKVIGLMALDHVSEESAALFRRFATRLEDLAMAIATQAAIAIENARLHEEAQRRAIQMEAAAEVARDATAILDVDQLLDATVRLISDQFGFYHAGVFLIDERREYAILRAGSSEGGQRMLDRGHKLAVGKVGIVGHVAGSGEPRIALDVGEDAVFFDNPDLPATRSEMALPLISRGDVIGVLDVQSIQEAAFGEDDVAVLQTMADQLANAIGNARLYEVTQRRVAELEAVRQASLHLTSTLELQPVLEAILESTLQLVSGDDAHIFLYDGERLSFGAAMWSGEVHWKPYAEPRQHGVTYTVARSGERVVVHHVKDHPLFQDGKWHNWDGAIVGLPLKIGDQVQGVMNVAFNRPHVFSDDELRVLELLADQAAIAIENARLYKGAQRHVEELTALHNIDVVISSTLSLEEVLQRVQEQVSELMDTTTFYIGLYDEEREELHLPLVVDRGKKLDPLNLSVQDSRGFAGWVIHNKQPLWIGDWEKERDTLSVEGILRGPPTRSLMLLPLISRDQIVGVISAQSYEPYAFDEHHRRLFSGIANQVAIAVENARLFEETARRLNKLSLLHEVALAAAATLDFDEILRRTVESVHSRLDLDVFGFLLVDEDAGVARLHPTFLGVPDEAADFATPLGEGITGWVAETGKPYLAHDVREAPHYVEATPGIRSEVCVPLTVGDKVIGVIDAESTRLNAFSESDVRLFSTLASQLGVVLENARLYRTLQEQRDELSQAYEELKEVERLRTELVQNVGHELRTPFTLIQGYIELLLAGDLGPLLDEQREALTIVSSRVSRLEHLIRNLTTLDKVSRGKQRMKPVPILSLLRLVLEGFRGSAELAGVLFHEELADDLPLVSGDYEQLELAFIHLIDNALKFSPEGGTVTVRAWANGGWTYVSIADEGIGIASEHLELIFERFYQIDGSASRRFGGMGIGLALVWEIVEAHGGTVDVESEPNEGSTFTVALPRARLGNRE